MGRVPMREGDHVEVFSTSVMGVVFTGTLHEFGVWKCNAQFGGYSEPDHRYSPREFVEMYVDNDWFLGPDEYERETRTVATLYLE